MTKEIYSVVRQMADGQICIYWDVLKYKDYN